MLHYLSGRIDVEVFFPLDCYPGAEQARRLNTELQQALAPLPHFRGVQVYYG